MANVGIQNDPRIQQAAQRFAENLEKRPIEEQLAVGAISKNVLNGCSWEFIRNVADFRGHEEDFKKNPNCSLQQVCYNHSNPRANAGMGYLVSMNLNYLCNVFSADAPGLITQEDLNNAVNHRKEAIESLYKKLSTRKINGKIGIYCTNDSQAITVNGKTYPAFAVSLPELCQVAQRAGYGMVISGAVRNPSDVMAREDAVLRSLIVAPSSNAVFIEIAPMR